MEQRLNAYEKAPRAMQALYALGSYLAKSALEKPLLNLVYFRVSQINGCAYCLDMHSQDLRAAGETEQRLFCLDAWREAPFYTNRERAALAWVEAVTSVAAGHVPDETYQNARQHFSEEALVDLTLAVITLLTEYELTNQPQTNALMALMCFHASRFAARQADVEGLVLYEQQDEALWNQALIQQGHHYLLRSAQGPEISSYHLEARIASWHCMKADTPEKWEAILQLYNQLLLLNYSPDVALNRTFALYKANGAHAALAEAEKLKLEHSYFYFLLLGELYQPIDRAKARDNLQKAYALAKTPAEKRNVLQKLNDGLA